MNTFQAWLRFQLWMAKQFGTWAFVSGVFLGVFALVLVKTVVQPWAVWRVDAGWMQALRMIGIKRFFDAGREQARAEQAAVRAEGGD